MKRLLLPLLLLSACASPRPKLYPNDHYKAVGEQTAKADVEECMKEAKHFVKSNKLSPAAEKTAWGAATGAAMGAVIGLITGDLRRVVASGAAAGGAAGAMHGAYDATKPDQVERAFTDRCLAEKGYAVLGWR